MRVSRIFVSGINPCFLFQIPVIRRQNLCAPLQNAHIFIPKSLSGYVPMSAIPSICHLGVGGLCAQSLLRKTRVRGGFNWVSLRRFGRNYFGARIYCSNPNPKPNPQSGSWFHKWLGTRALWSVQEYELAAVIAIRPLI